MNGRRLRPLLALPLAALAFLAGCGGSTRHPARTVKLPPAVVNQCPQAIQGHGGMGGCAPPQVAVKLGSKTAVASGVHAPAGITFPDLSNNDPCVCGATLRQHGLVGEIDKANQGVGFLDGTFYRMIVDAKAHGLAVGGYDFDQEYTQAEAYAFVGQLHRAGIWRNTPNTFPPTLDVEYGASSRAGVERQLAVLYQQFGRAQIYTGGWYWIPHFGCWWPRGVPAWLSGYPAASVFCGLPGSLFAIHQFTDHGYTGASWADMNVWRGSSASFDAYVHRAGPGESAAAKHRRLLAAVKARSELRQLVLKHECAPGGHRHATPHTRWIRRTCNEWLQDGQEASRVVRALSPAGARAASVTSIVTRLSPDHTAVEVAAEPQGTASIVVAVMSDTAGAGLKYLRVPGSQVKYTPPAATPVVDMVAQDSSYRTLGSWGGRLQTTPAVVAPPAPAMIVGVDTGGWPSASGLFSDLAGGGIRYYRMQSGAAPGNVAGVKAAGGHIASVIFGEGGTIGSINPTSYSGGIVSYFSTYGRDGGRAVEVLNEPGGSWFFSDPTNYTAYTRIARAVHEGLLTLPAASRPVELCSWDGGASSSTWGQGIKAAGALSYCDGVTVHPYGGSSGQFGGALGNRRLVEAAHAGSGLPVYVTEAGWPSAAGQPSTGDSQQWTESQQASNITGFTAWARATGYVRLVIVFNAVDYGTRSFYGVERNPSRAHKLSFAAVAAASG